MVRVFPPKSHLLYLVLFLIVLFASIVAARNTGGMIASSLSETLPTTGASSSTKPSDTPGKETVSAQGRWTIGASLNVARNSHTATLLPNGKVLVAGGMKDLVELGSAELYDSATDTFTLTGNLISARHNHSATLLANGKVLVAGGENNNQVLDTAEIYDPNAGTWSSAASLTTKRLFHTATLLTNGKVLVTGGNGAAITSAELYDPTLNTWTSAASLPSGRIFFAATLLQNGKVLVGGGLTDGNTSADHDAQLYNPATNSWASAGGPLKSRYYSTLTVLPSGNVLIAAGTDNQNTIFREADLYDPATNLWSSTESLGATHTVDNATLLSNGKVLAIGNDHQGTFLSEVYDPATGTWTGPLTLHDERWAHTATLLPNGKVLATGGYIHPGGLAPDITIATSELYDPSASTASGGPRIVFGSNRHGGNHDIYSMELDGTDETRLTTSLAYDDQPKWSPDNSKIVFMSGRDGNLEIYKMNADGSAQTRVTNNPLADGFPAWSPDGTKIAFIRGNLENPSTFEVYVMNSDGTNEVRLTNDGAIDGVPSWSPDGTRIVFMSGGSSVFDPNSFEIYSIGADGNNRTRLTNNSIVDGQPSYSPDGTKILFASGNALNPNGIEIYVMNVDGSNRVQLTSNNVTDGFPAWSFDGLSIVFASGSVNDETSVELFMMNANGTNRAKITTNADLDWFPDWQRMATPPSYFSFTSPSYAVNEGAGGYYIIVSRIGNTTGLASVDYATSDTAGASDCNVVSSAASSRCDYETTRGTLKFAPGETSKIITVFRIEDSYAESSESFTVSLSNPTGSGVSLTSPSIATVTIADDDSVTGANPIDNPGFFVFWHYLDFLNREPDAAGADFWTEQITSCGSDAQCIEIRRINVSAAFFLSIEFQETGYLVYRFYKAGHGAVGMPVPVRYEEFISDTQQIGQGVIIGQPGADAKLEANKQDFARDFVLRLRFIQDHPTSQTPNQFVDSLYANAEVIPSASERTSVINEFGGAPNTVDTAARTRALRLVADNSTLKQQELNKAFVLMEYFGYLRRNPFDPPEATLDFQGYNFWLNKLNQFNGNFVNAEMVKAFIISGEYRHRFGP